MTTMMSPKNMLIAGIVLVLLNVLALAPMATGAVEEAVEEKLCVFLKGKRLRQRCLYRGRRGLGRLHFLGISTGIPSPTWLM